MISPDYGASDSGTDISLPKADYAALDAFAVANGLSLTNVPEPASGSLLLIGVGILTQRKRRRPGSVQG